MILPTSSQKGRSILPKASCPAEIDIEGLLCWAYRRELPKQPRIVLPGDYAPGWDAVSGQGAMLVETVDDRVNRHGVVADPFAVEGPDRDALIVAAAVDALADPLEVHVPDGWSLFADVAAPATEALLGEAQRAGWAALTVERPDGARVLRDAPDGLVRRHALLGDAPDWGCERPVAQEDRWPNGRARWHRIKTVTGRGGWAQVDGRRRWVPAVGYTFEADDGWDALARRPHPGAYRKAVLVPDMVDAAVRRIEYELWHAALVLLAGELAGLLARWRVTGPARAARPWEERESPPAKRVLIDLAAAERRFSGTVVEVRRARRVLGGGTGNGVAARA